MWTSKQRIDFFRKRHRFFNVVPMDLNQCYLYALVSLIVGFGTIDRRKIIVSSITDVIITSLYGDKNRI
jgi:hypothetical protein